MIDLLMVIFSDSFIGIIHIEQVMERETHA